MARYLFRRVVSWGRSSNVFLENGARLYLDVGSHPEYATPECDNVLDVLAPSPAATTLAAAVLDAGNDDYYGHAGSWWDVQDSPWLRHLDVSEIRLRVVTDGELRRSSWQHGITERIIGTELKAADVDGAVAFSSGLKSPIVRTVAKLRRGPGGLVLDDFKFTKSLTDRTVKVTVPAPMVLYRGLADNTVGKIIESLLRVDLIILDELGYVLKQEPAIAAFEAKRVGSINTLA